MKNLLFYAFFVSLIFANSEINYKFSDPSKCADCHKEQYDDWKTSIHAISHENKSELYRETIKYVSLDLHKTKEQLLIECGTCHNPRLEVKDFSSNYMLSKAFEVSTQESQKNDQALKAKHIQNGIGCYICHNVDSIKKDENLSGYHKLNWTSGDIIIGPYADVVRGNDFHISQSRNFLRLDNSLCLVCHQQNVLNGNFKNYETGDEMALVQNNQTCTSCHMLPFREDFIDKNTQPEKAKRRTLKSHFFDGVRNSDISKSALKLSFDDKTKILHIRNLTPHKVPTGFSGRNLQIKITYQNKNSQKIKNEEFNLRSVYTNKMGQRSLSYNAATLKKDTRLMPFELKNIQLTPPQNTNFIKVEIFYYILDKDLQEYIQVKDQKFTKPYLIMEKIFKN